MIGVHTLTSGLMKVLLASFLAVSSGLNLPQGPKIDRDKTGTSGTENGTKNPQACIYAGSAGVGSNGAERGGFEPPVPVSQDTAFPVPHNRPLCHLSGWLGQRCCSTQGKHNQNRGGHLLPRCFMR